MVWLIIAAGLALCGGGATAILSGLSYMPVEWGWSQLIAGTVALSAGVVTIALAAVFGRLGAIHKTLRLGVADPAPVPLPVRPSPVFTRPEPLADAIPEPEAMQIPNLGPVGLAAREQASRDREEAMIESHGVDPWIDAAPAPGPPEPLYASLEPEPASLSPVAEPVARPFRPLLTGLKARFGGRRAVQEDAPVPRATADALANGFDEPSWAFRTTEPDFPQAPAEHEAASEHRPDIVDADETKSLVGRYEAGAASYALYSDGTIEVETDSGTQRFASMDDLKRFLAR